MTVNKMITKIKDNRYTIAFILTAINESLPDGESCEIGISYAGEFLLIHNMNGQGFIAHSDSNFTDFIEYLSWFKRNTDNLLKRNTDNLIDKKDE